ncbi:IS6 family transposase [Agrobacterium vitis]|uniref:DDE-type integrase/transposase/recombinase n=1 Tax=Agrobacterium vitis TaxID=373 RepID=A0AAE5AWK8_AGRVI|nr:DDE-type integrase/transposase/recombinase [Agrobacterium vitis]MCF1500066.1 IS6 family transposase [Allorhizobium sp. Av2]MCM2442249.1 IS6 family transposase [Agrobacterium vitis]MUZ58659.1 DDE-type integrase/transposase/recombinase [Agrobacterium vitis]MVA66294.1 DDE-type integrase/transposase/recombinase [Agrobacterium vitis]MVA88331.1 DDE-type integrase/transposase/recombinase [Agrobacterium vitis]
MLRQRIFATVPVILYAVFFYVRYAVSYRDLEEIMAERGVKVDHATLNRWFVKYSPLIAREAHRRKSTTSTFFARTIGNSGWPEKVVIDKSGANLAGLQNMNWLLQFHGWFWLIEIVRIKYLNNIIEQDHRFIKKLTRPMKGFKSFSSASATLDGIEVAHMIRKGQFQTAGQSAFQQFAELAA